MMPAKLPEDLIQKPKRYLRDLKVEESAWIDFNYMVVNEDRHCFLDPETTIHEEKPLSIRVTRTIAGFEVWIPATKIPLGWRPGDFTIGPEYYPVIKLEREEKSQ